MAITPLIKSIEPVNVEFLETGLLLTLRVEYDDGAEGIITKKLTNIRSTGVLIKAVVDVMKIEGYY